MVQLIKALAFGAAAWFAIAVISAVIPMTQVINESDSQLLMIPVAVIVIIIAALEYLKEIHAQYEAEGLELATVWLVESVFLEAAVYVVFYGKGIGHFLSIGTWLGIAFKFVFPLAAGFYMQHMITE